MVAAFVLFLSFNRSLFFNDPQAYIEIAPTNGGEFQFGLVVGSIDGDLEDNNGKG